MMYSKKKKGRVWFVFLINFKYLKKNEPDNPLLLADKKKRFFQK